MRLAPVAVEVGKNAAALADVEGSSELAESLAVVDVGGGRNATG